MDGWKVLTLVYGCLYCVLVYMMLRESLAVGYPAAYVAWAMGMQVMVVAGVFAHALDRGGSIAHIWRWLFALMIVDLVVGISVDAVVPTHFNIAKDGMAWIANLLLNLWLLAPAYYLNFRIAYRGA